jgi:hypothetical protein
MSQKTSISPPWACRSCKRFGTFTWERCSDGRCVDCAKAESVTLLPEEIETALRQYICATRLHLAQGYVVDVNWRTGHFNAFKPEA